MACHRFALNSGASRGTLPVPALHMSRLQRGHWHTHWMDWYTRYKRTCAFCSAHWLIKVSSERAREAEEGSREEREHLCDVTSPYFTQNSTSDLYFLKRLNHWSEQASQRKVRFFRRRGKKLAVLRCFFLDRILLGRDGTLVMLRFSVFDSFSSLLVSDWCAERIRATTAKAVCVFRYIRL